ncbi:MAG TPA: hypothetical protein VHM90_10495, partial [Phycisphaerae bacterium]|nr:hypothetical protein [Phycisphaerae bacterium]
MATLQTELLLCIADHYEPQCGKVSPSIATARLNAWLELYPHFKQFHDAHGNPPRHSFFFPIDEYDPAHVDAVASLCRQGLGEVEIHHHHDHDTPQKLHDRLLQFTSLFRNRHGLLASAKSPPSSSTSLPNRAPSTDPSSENSAPKTQNSDSPRYAFVHGNWALNNSRPDGRWCGINNEIKVLLQTGCYADFTMPSYPSNTQTTKVNSIYYAQGHDHKPKGHDTGIDVGSPESLRKALGVQAPPCSLTPSEKHPHLPTPPGMLMMIQGPLLRNWRNRKWGLYPRMENACLQGNQPPTMERLKLWLKAAIRVPRRPDWRFVKLHTHGAVEKNAAVLLGEPMKKFHHGLASLAKENP